MLFGSIFIFFFFNCLYSVVDELGRMNVLGEKPRGKLVSKKYDLLAV